MGAATLLQLLPMLLALLPNENSSTPPMVSGGATDTDQNININVAGPTVHVGTYQGDTHGPKATTINTNRQIALTSTQLQAALVTQLIAALEKQGTNLTELTKGSLFL